MPSKSPAGGVLLGHTHRFVVVALAVWVVMALVVPAAAGTGQGPTAAGAGVPQITWAACGPQLECANVPVPLDWAHPNGPTIALAVAPHLASHPQQRIGSLFVNPGGPGGSGVATVADRGDALDALTQGRFANAQFNAGDRVFGNHCGGPEARYQMATELGGVTPCRNSPA